MIKKNILSIALLSVLGLSQAAEVENLKTISYLNEPLRLHADVLGEGNVAFAAPTEYLRLNHPIPSYDLSIDIVELAGKRELIVTTTEPIDVPVLTLLLESRDSENRKQLFELPILLDFKPDPIEETIEDNSEIVIDGVKIDADVSSNITVINALELVDVPLVVDSLIEKKEPSEKPKETASSNKASNKKSNKVDEPKRNIVQEDKTGKAVENKSQKTVVKSNVTPTKVKGETPKDSQKKLQEASDALTVENNNALIKRYGPVAQGETLWSIANKVRPSNTPAQKMIEIIKKNNPSAFTANGVLRANAVLIIPGETAKVQSNFVKSQNDDTSGKVRVGFIYELPAPPETKVASSDEAVPAKVVQPAADQSGNTVADTKTVETQSSTDESSVTSSTQVVGPAKALQPTENITKTEVVSNVENETKVAETAAAVQEPVKKRPVFVMPEPEPEPGIVELLFDNIIYIGAGAAVLILAALAVAMRRRTKDGDSVKPPKKEKKAKGPGNKKKDDENGSKDIAKSKKKGFSLFGKKKASDEEDVPVEKPKKKAKSLFGKKKNKEELSEVDVVSPVVTAVAVGEMVAPKTQNIVDDTISEDFVVEVIPEDTIESVDDLDFDLSSLEQIDDEIKAVDSSKVAEVVEDFDLDFDLSSLEQIDDEVNVVDASKVAETIDDLDFDLSSLEQIDDKVNVMDAPKLAEAVDDLDLDLSSLAQDSGLANNLVGATDSVQKSTDIDFGLSLDDISIESDAAKAEDFGNLDFDLSLDDIKVEGGTVESEALGDLDFDLSFEELVEDKSAAHDIERENQVLDGLEFDLSELESSGSNEKIIEDVFDKHQAQPISDDDFGENNPLFSSQASATDNVEKVGAKSNENNEDSAYVSFSDLMQSAETEVNAGELNESVNFTGVDDDKEAKLANLFEASARDDADAKLDFSFVAETEDVDGSQNFLDSIDLSDDSDPSVDVIGDSIKDNIAKTEESMTEMSNTSQMESEESELEEVTLVEPVMVEESELEDATLVEPMVVEAPVVEKVTLVEPEVVDVEKPMVKEVGVLASGLESSEDDNESEQIKLELAVAYMDFDKNLAKPLLEEVIHDGNANQVAKAKELLAQMG